MRFFKRFQFWAHKPLCNGSHFMQHKYTHTSWADKHPLKDVPGGMYYTNSSHSHGSVNSYCGIFMIMSMRIPISGKYLYLYGPWIQPVFSKLVICCCLIIVLQENYEYINENPYTWVFILKCNRELSLFPVTLSHSIIFDQLDKIITMVADVLAPNRCQAISNHHAVQVLWTLGTTDICWADYIITTVADVQAQSRHQAISKKHVVQVLWTWYMPAGLHHHNGCRYPSVK